MSQKKVDQYKKEKANRSQIIKKEKRLLFLEKIIALAVCAVLVCWVGFSIYGKATSSNAEPELVDTQINTSALDDYISGLSAEAE